MTLRNADPDLNENSGGWTDLGQKMARIGGFPYPYSSPSLNGHLYETDNGQPLQLTNTKTVCLYLLKRSSQLNIDF